MPETGRADEFLELLADTATFRPTCNGPAATARAFEYTRFAEPFRDDRDLAALGLPGQQVDEPLPATLDAALDLQAAALDKHVAGRPYVLAGHSLGALIAYALAHRMESTDHPPDGVVVIDGYHPDQDVPIQTWWPEIWARTVLTPGTDVDDHILLALGHYVRLLGRWRDPGVTTPVLLIRPTSPLGAWPTGDQTWRAVWPSAHTVADAPGDHLSMMAEHVTTTAEAVQRWLV